MQIDEIFNEMDKDLEIGDDLASASTSTPFIKAKWLRRLFDEQMHNKQLSDNLADIMPSKFELYSYKSDVKPARRDVYDTYIPADKEYQPLSRILEMSTKKVELMENIIKSLDQRSFHIKNAIEWRIFIAGGQHG